MKGSCSKTWKNPKNNCWMLNLRKSLSVKIHKNLPAVKEEYLVQPYCRRGLGEGGAIVTCCSQPGCNWNRETASGNIDINRSHIPSKLSHPLKIVTTRKLSHGSCHLPWKLSHTLKIVTSPENCHIHWKLSHPMDLFHKSCHPEHNQRWLQHLLGRGWCRCCRILAMGRPCHDAPCPRPSHTCRLLPLKVCIVII